MSRRKTKYGHFDINLDAEAKRIQKELKKEGIKCNYRQATKIAAFRSKNSSFTVTQMKKLVIDDLNDLWGC